MRSLTNAGQLRLARYQPDGQPGSQILYAEHTDYNGFTFLWRSRTNGLEAKLNGSWTPVPLLPNNPHALLVNLGDLMEVWTGGVWRSPRHQVLRSSQKQGELLSIVWFAGLLAAHLFPSKFYWDENCSLLSRTEPCNSASPPTFTHSPHLPQVLKNEDDNL